MAESTRFDLAGEEFLGEYDKVRGHVREMVTRANLTLWLPAGDALRVLDFGGGDGRDTVWLANMRDHVTLLDESPNMVKLATQAIKKAKISALGRIKIIEGGLEEVTNQTFDVVLSHGVLMYELNDPLSQLQALSDRLDTGGILSLLTKGHAAAEKQMTDSEAAERFKATGEYVNRRGLLARAYRFGELEDMLGRTGLETIASYGVRLLSDEDSRRLNDVPGPELQAILEKEVAASRDSDLVEQAQMIHIIARKPAGQPARML